MALGIKRLKEKGSYKIVAAFFICWFIFSFQSFSQSSFLPKNLGENINSTYAEINPVVSSDGNTLYFTKVIPAAMFGELEKQEIWYSEKDPQGNWGKASRMGSNLNIGQYNSVLAVSGDGQTLLINGVFNRNGNLWRKRGLSIVKKEGVFWGTPRRLKIKKYSKQNKGLSSNATMSFDGNYLVLSFTKSYNRKNLDIYLAQNKGNRWSKPKRLKSEINSKHSEEAPFLSANNQLLYFSRKTRGGNPNASDIYVSQRLGDNWKKWSTPKKLSDTINSAKWESYFKTNEKGSEAYFSSDNNSKGWSDIYSVKLFEENPFILVKGMVLNTTTNKHLSSKYPIRILVNGQVVDSVKIQLDSSYYTLKLPFGKKYTISASVPKFISKAQVIDASLITEYTVKNQNLLVTPLPFVTVSGNVFQKGTNEILPAESLPRIAIDGNIIDSLIIDSITGRYSLQIPYGKSYQFKVIAKNYSSLSETLDLSNVHEYKELNKNLYADPIREKSATIKGAIIDKKTNKPLTENETLKVIVNGQEFSSKLNSSTASYEIELPLGTIYTINASSEGYYPVYETIDLKDEKESIRVLKDLQIVPIEVGQSVRLNNIFFNPAKITLQKNSFPELDRVARFLTENENIVIEISGHTDNVGKAASNMALSLGRAKSVEKYLLSKGVSQSQVTSKGYGVTKPVESNKTAKGRSLNRRVEFIILDK